MWRTGRSKTCVWRWQERFMQAGYDCLWAIRTRPSRIPPLGSDIDEGVGHVLSVDEKRKSYALDRTQPGLPMKKGRAGTMTHDYNATAHNAIRCSRRTRGRAGRHLRLNGDEEAHKILGDDGAGS
jgi:hypothetical protein